MEKTEVKLPRSGLVQQPIRQFLGLFGYRETPYLWTEVTSRVDFDMTGPD